jgi:murein L,D-transpeptidase YafK
MRFVAVIIVIALGAGAYYLSTPEGRALLDRVAINAKRAEHRALFRAGETLPGTPDLTQLERRLAARGVSLGVPIFIRIFKLESELELWVRKDGRFVHFATYPICFWSGRLGPKLQEGDRQAPEGFYTVDADALNPNSVEHRSFNLGFPNAYDRAQGRTGSFLMVHGGCSSTGCYAMTHPVVDEIWRMVTAALEAGQPRFAAHAFPFRMTERNMRLRRGQTWSPFWDELKRGYDLFERTGVPPAVSVCESRYVIEPGNGESPVPAVEERCPSEIAVNP